jgi:hypothetical protein
MNLIEKRLKIYNEFPKDKLLNTNIDIVLFYSLNDSDYIELVQKTQNYLCKSLSLIQGKEFEWSQNFLKENEDLIKSLPNKTPNGILSPKKEIISEFTEIQISITKILRKLGISNHIKTLLPPNVRFKASNEISEIKSRPYYTGKYHSDAWVGHIGDCQILIGVLGDIENNTVEFNRPIGISDDYLNKAESFDDGNKRYTDLEYLGKLTKQKLCIMDHSCVHRTLINDAAGPRISIDVAVMFDSEYSHSFDEDFGKSPYNYHDIKTIESIGIEKRFETEESIFNTQPTILKIIKK